MRRFGWTWVATAGAALLAALASGCASGDCTGEACAVDAGGGAVDASTPGAGDAAATDAVPVPDACTGVEICDALDNDCDDMVDEGCECTNDTTQACYTGPAATRGVGQCRDGMQTCADGAWGACEDDVTPIAEACNTFDDDCDGTPDDGDPGGGAACSTGMPGVCGPGVNHCVAGAVSCVATMAPGTELCNGLDDDCNPATADGAADPGVGVACDGGDSDLCLDGTTLCSGSITCNDGGAGALDVCNGMNDDCDPASADGTEDPLNGAGCDGVDSDLCVEGTYACAGGALACSDTTGHTLDVCDGVNNDCDPASADGSEDPMVGAGCDGADSDKCNEGSYACAGGALSCNDATGSTVDVCNGFDDDCDAASGDGAEDPALGLGCDGADGDVCVEGTYNGCSGGVLTCSDVTGTTTELCNGADDDCDGTIDDGWVRDDSPLCSAGTFFIGSVSGDLGAETTSDSWYDEEWDLLQIREDSSSSIYLSATISLTSAPGTDFDLYVYCNDCVGNLAGSSTLGGMTGHTDTVYVRSNDDLGPDDTFNVIIEVRHWASTVCANWNLAVTGNTSVGTETCN